MFTLITGIKSLKTSIFVVATFVILKLFTHFLIYKEIKYKDDGRDHVSFMDFICIHITFPAIDAWASYLLIFVFF
jgi:hypothetical protein